MLSRHSSVDLSEVDDYVLIGRTLDRELSRSKVVHFSAPAFSSSSLQHWETAAGQLGLLLRNGEESASGKPNGDAWLDVRYRAEHQHTFRHSCTAQPLHTDDAYKSPEDTANYVLFLVEKAASAGGETYFVDAAQLAGYLGETDPKLLELLCTVPVSFAKHVEGKSCPILSQVGEDWEVNWNYYNVDAQSSDEVAELRQRFHLLLQTEALRSRLAYGFNLKPSEGVVWHDRKVLHGRTAFEPGERVIWKCSIR